jgi:D-alanyl-D-alanine carboxypeptidase/D-alanyl-D-alanine-endopeptidase (penicillin-binding protein 4)
VHAAAALEVLLAERGVTIRGEAGRAQERPAGKPFARVRSPRVSAIVAAMITSSDNFVAEMLGRAIAREVARETTTAAGTRAIRRQLDAAGIRVRNVGLADASGLSRDNRATCAALLATLRTADERRELGAVVTGLADAGDSGTLVERFVGTAVEGRLHAKTGQLDGVTGLVGYIDGPQRVRFAFIANGTFDESTGFLLQDQLVRLLDTYASLANDLVLPEPGA